LGKHDSIIEQPIFGGNNSNDHGNGQNDIRNEGVRETASFVDKEFTALLNHQHSFNDKKMNNDRSSGPFDLVDRVTPKVTANEMTPKSRPS
jgi:hypothetical protein